LKKNVEIQIVIYKTKFYFTGYSFSNLIVSLTYCSYYWLCLFSVFNFDFSFLGKAFYS